MTQELRFRQRDSPESQSLREWHRVLLTQPRRGDRARLRRSRSIEEAAMEPAFHDLLRRLGRSPGSRTTSSAPEAEVLSELAALAATAAMVENDEQIALGRQMGRPREGSSASPVSAARFRRLLEAEALEDRFHVLRRTLPLLDRRVDLTELARVLRDWTPALRRRLAYDYYDSAPQAQEAH